MAGAAGTSIGSINFGVTMDTKKLAKQSKQARGMIGRFTAGTKKALAGVGKLTVGLVSLATVGFGALAKAQLTAVDKLAKTADKLGITTESLAGLQLAAELTGVEITTLDKSLVNLTKATSEAAQGVGLGVRAFAMLGIEASKLNQLSPDQQFLEVADAIAKMTNEQDQLTVATQLFGTRGAALINTLKLGKDGLKATAAEAEALGLAISRTDAAQIEAANDAVTRMKAAFDGAVRTLTVEMAPAITHVADGIKSWMQGMKESKDFISGGDISGGWLGTLLDIVHTIKTGFLGLRMVVTKVISSVVANFDMLAKTMGGLIRQLEGIPGIGDTAGGIADQLESGFLDQFSQELGKASADTSKDFWDAFEAEMPSEKMARKAADALAEAPKDAGPTAFDKLSGFAGGALDMAKGLGKGAIASGKQAVSGVANDPILQALGSLVKANIMTPPGQAQQQQKQAAFAGAGPIGFSEAGSAEAFRQRVKIQRGDENKKLDKDRNELLKKIAKNSDKATTQPANLEN